MIRMRTFSTAAGVACVALATATAVAAQGTGQGPVATACQEDIAKFCAGLEHGQGAVRKCLQSNKEKVSAGCKTALDTTGPGSGMGGGKGPAKP